MASYYSSLHPLLTGLLVGSWHEPLPLSRLVVHVLGGVVSNTVPACVSCYGLRVSLLLARIWNFDVRFLEAQQGNLGFSAGWWALSKKEAKQARFYSASCGKISLFLIGSIISYFRHGAKGVALCPPSLCGGIFLCCRGFKLLYAVRLKKYHRLYVTLCTFLWGARSAS